MKKVNKKDEGQAMWKYYKFDAITVTSIYSGVLFHLQLRACFCIYRITPFDVNNFIVNDLPKSKHISFLELKTIIWNKIHPIQYDNKLSCKQNYNSNANT